MSRLSREKKRDQQRGTTPIDVRVPLTGESATVAGTPVTAPPGEDLHQTVLTHLHHLALTGGHPVHATIHDARIGYVVPLEVTTDGSSRFTAEPVRMAPPGSPPSAGGEESAETPWPSAGADPDEEPPQLPRSLDEPARDPAPTFRLRNMPEPQPADAEPSPTQVLRQLPHPRRADPAPAQPPGTVAPPMGEFGPPPVMDASPAPTPAPLSPTDFAYAPRPLPQPAPAPTPAPPSSDAGPAPLPPSDSAPAPEPRPQPDPAPTPAPPPSDAGPAPLPPSDSAPEPRPRPDPAPTPAPPSSDAGPTPVPPPSDAVAAPQPPSNSAPAPAIAPRPLPTAGFAGVPQPLPSASAAPRPAAPLIDSVPLLDDPGPKPTPVRGFDAVAEALLGEGLVVEDSAVLAEPVGRISEAVQEGRTDVAAELAERVVGEASETLGAEHPDVLRVRELAAYIAYLGGEPVRAAEISLDLADIHHRAGDAESAYGNVQSATTAWKAVRDPLRGLELGRDLLTLWTDLAAGEGPAAEDPDKLESARARMLRLAERARNADR
ncbi:hypothetical protein [Streptomyces canus]|uniref:hypothetical protein n=1 Tax=Streptomyces canus TaxID=58343 RepID=UPI000749EC8D|nr:hypothetical protein [Streptomyces canus]KUN12793.1 hypothetical protein AQI96_13505 [Streptomyces canus]